MEKTFFWLKTFENFAQVVLAGLIVFVIRSLIMLKRETKDKIDNLKNVENELVKERITIQNDLKGLQKKYAESKIVSEEDEIKTCFYIGGLKLAERTYAEQYGHI